MAWLDLLRPSMRQSMNNKLILKMLFCAVGYLSGMAIVRHVPSIERDHVLIGLCVLVAISIHDEYNKYFENGE